MVPVIIKWKAGSPTQFKPGQFLVYESGGWELVGCRFSPSFDQEIVKHAILIEPHELEWLQSMATKRHLGDSK